LKKHKAALYADLAEPIAVLKIGIIMQRRIRATTLANRWAFKLDPIIRKTYSNEGLDQVEILEILHKMLLQINFFRNYKWSFRN
jgi:hypothetical protein